MLGERIFPMDLIVVLVKTGDGVVVDFEFREVEAVWIDFQS